MEAYNLNFLIASNLAHIYPRNRMDFFRRWKQSVDRALESDCKFNIVEFFNFLWFPLLDYGPPLKVLAEAIGRYVACQGGVAMIQQQLLLNTLELELVNKEGKVIPNISNVQLFSHLSELLWDEKMSYYMTSSFFSPHPELNPDEDELMSFFKFLSEELEKQFEREQWVFIFFEFFLFFSF